MEDEKRLKELTTEQTDFKREIGVFGGVSIIGGIMIGSGIFYLGSYVLQRTGMNSGLAHRRHHLPVRRLMLCGTGNGHAESGRQGRLLK